MRVLPVVFESTADTAEGGRRHSFNIKEKLAFIANDSLSYDLLINFDKTVTESGTFTLKAGEILSDIPLNCTTISVQGVGGSVAFRCLGV